MAYLGTPIDTTNQFQSLVGKRFSGDASTTAFTLDVAPTSTLDIEVFVENVRQDPNSAYSLSGTTLTFAAAPPSGTNNIYVVHQAKAVGTISPAAGTVNADSFDNTVISGHTALTTTPADTDELLISDAGTIKRIDYSVLVPASDNINMIDIYKLSSTINPTASNTSTAITNFAQYTTSPIANIGTGMTHSSGTFSFPSTGLYEIQAFLHFHELSNNYQYVQVEIQLTTDNSSYNLRAKAVTVNPGNAGGDTKTSVYTSTVVDITDTSNQKVKIHYLSSSTAILQGDEGSQVVFKRLANT